MIKRYDSYENIIIKKFVDLFEFDNFVSHHSCKNVFDG